MVSERQYAGDLGATELLLGNGMRVCFKPTTFLDDEVMLTGFAFGGMSEVRLREGEFLFGRWQPPPQFMVRGAGGCTSSPYYPPTMVTATPILPPTVLPPPALSCPGSCSPQAQCPGPLRASWGYAATSPQSWETSWQVRGGQLVTCDVVLAPHKAGALSRQFVSCL